MSRLTGIAIAAIVVALGVALYEEDPSCSGSIGFPYTDPLSAIYTGSETEEVVRQCEFLVAELIDFETIAAQADRSEADVVEQLSVDALRRQPYSLQCRITYLGRDNLETIMVLNWTADALVEGVISAASTYREIESAASSIRPQSGLSRGFTNPPGRTRDA